MNILFTCAGRRNYLINYFREELHGEGKIIAADYSTEAAAMEEADIAVPVPSVYDKKYISSLSAIIEKYEVNLLISLNDLELPILAANRELLENKGCKVVLSSTEVIDICFDKLKTIQFAKKIGIRSPLTFSTLHDALNALNNGTIEFPLVIKPRWGSSSVGIEFPESVKELKLAYELINTKLDKSILKESSSVERDRALLIQNKLDGDEYGVDVINDFNQVNRTVIVKKKVAMRSGETDKAKTVYQKELMATGALIGEKLGHIGNLDCDFFIGQSGEIYLLEMNPRFGGGYPFSHEAGVNLPKAILAWYKGSDVEKNCFDVKQGKLYAKCDRLIEINNKNVEVINSAKELKL